MQVFCGITIDQQVAGAGHGDTACAVALVAAGGGLIATDTFGDDPRGWVRLNSLLARSAPGQSVSVAVDGEVTQLAEFAAAAGQLVVRAASPASRSKDALDDAIAMARGMATGEVSGQPFAARPEINALRPILDTVASAARARHDAAEALTCLLRAVFPAALAAWDDPSEANAVAILTRLPQPGALQSISTEELAADLATVADPGQVAAMAGALTEAIREIGGGDDPSVAPSVSATADAVSAWDRALEGLIGLLQAKRPKPEAPGLSAPPVAEEPPVRRFGHDTHQTVRLPGDLPDRQKPPRPGPGLAAALGDPRGPRSDAGDPGVLLPAGRRREPHPVHQAPPPRAARRAAAVRRVRVRGHAPAGTRGAPPPVAAERGRPHRRRRQPDERRRRAQ